MKNFFKIRPFAKLGIIAIPLLIFMVLMENYFPKTYPEGFQSFIIAFEFAKTPEQIHQLFNGFTADTFRNINIGNYIDYGFMFTYTLFLVLFFKKAANTFNKKWLLTGIPLAIVILFADFLENIYLLQITDIYTPSVTDADLNFVLRKLHIITWVKWGGLACIFALFSVKSMGKKILTHIEGVVFIIPLLLSFWALSNEPLAVSAFTLSIVLAFFLLLFYCFWFKAKKIEKLKKKLAFD